MTQHPSFALSHQTQRQINDFTTFVSSTINRIPYHSNLTTNTSLAASTIATLIPHINGNNQMLWILIRSICWKAVSTPSWTPAFLSVLRYIGRCWTYADVAAAKHAMTFLRKYNTTAPRPSPGTPKASTCSLN
jgi:hypothetical protein